MANEIFRTYLGSGSVYAVITRVSDDKVWSVTATDWEAYSASNIGDYDIPLSQTGNLPNEFTADFPTDITSGTVIRIRAYEQQGGSPAVGDLEYPIGDTAVGTWSGSAVTETDVPGSPAEALTSYVGNFYTTLDAVKNNLDETSTDYDGILMRIIEGVSREVDAYTDRHFYVWTGAKRFDPVDGDTLLIPDLLSVSAFATDTEQDGSFDDETWVENTDYFLQPYGGFPYTRVEISSFGSYSFLIGKRTAQITGNWGYGDGLSATPYRSLGKTVTVADASTTSATASASGLNAGQTLLLDAEQIFVSNVSGTSLTIRRAMNGTTAASHTTATANAYTYPMDISNICAYRAASLFEQRDSLDLKSEKIGDWSATYARDGAGDKIFERVLGPYRRLVVA